MHGPLYRELMNDRVVHLRADALRRARQGPGRATIRVARVLRATAARLDGHGTTASEPCL